MRFMKAALLPLLTAFALLLAGCASPPADDGEVAPRRGGSPTGALLRGEIATDEYLEAIADANRQDRANEQFEINKEPTRAYNTRSQRFEYVPDGSVQKWNERTQRWEFTPRD
jgi:hypothetical protein